jgi:hypothetical protein
MIAMWASEQCVQYFFELRQAGCTELIGPDLWHGLSEEVSYNIYKGRAEDVSVLTR